MKRALQQTFIPGDEWLFLKIYLNPDESDSVILNSIYPAIRYEFAHKHIDSKGIGDGALTGAG